MTSIKNPNQSNDESPRLRRGDKNHGRRADAGGAGGRHPRPELSVFTTTLWEYPSQHYTSASGMTEQGDKDYAGATPSWIIWQLLQRYTREKDLIVDPMCGSGTTIDVARDLGRRALGYDLNPPEERLEQQEQVSGVRSQASGKKKNLKSQIPDTRHLTPDTFAVLHADARKLPLQDGVADFVFIDPPYSTHIDYSDDPRCIGKLDAAGADGGKAYYDAMDKVTREAHRILKNRRYIALYVSDSWKKKKAGASGAEGKGASAGVFMPIGFELFSILRRYFQPIDIIAVVRHNAKLTKGNWHKAAREENFFLRGFNYLFVMKKVEG